MTQALCGFSFTIKQLDDRIIQVVHAGGQVIKPDSWHSVADEGMPMQGRPYERGNLYIKFIVVFPDSLDEVQVAALRNILPAIPAESAPEATMEVDDVEQVQTCFASPPLS